MTALVRRFFKHPYAPPIAAMIVCAIGYCIAKDCRFPNTAEIFAWLALFALVWLLTRESAD